MLIFAVLIFIAAELYIIARELSRAITLVLKERENHEGKSSGQTINVNVTPTGSGAQNASPTLISSLGVLSETKNEENKNAETELKGTVEQESPEIKERVILSKAAESGALSVKCSRCKMENSSYRFECFNCGERL